MLTLNYCSILPYRYQTEAGKRVFDINIDGIPMATKLDVYKFASGVREHRSGVNGAYSAFGIHAIRTLGTSVKIELKSILDAPLLNAIEIVDVAEGPVPYATPIMQVGMRSTAGHLTAAEKQMVLDQHNNWRSLTALGQTPNQPKAKDMHQVVWNDELAAGAAKWATSCPTGHDPAGGWHYSRSRMVQ